MAVLVGAFVLLLSMAESSKELTKGVGDDGTDLQFHSAGIVFDNPKRSPAEDEQRLMELTQGQNDVRNISAMENLASSYVCTTCVQHSSNASGGMPGGLAWDKHDFEVTNNKGGDVKVDINLAIPMSEGMGSSGSGGADDGDDGDLADVLRLLAPEDPVVRAHCTNNFMLANLNKVFVISTNRIHWI
jgi:hypothetical protein